MTESAVRVRGLGKQYQLYDRPSDRLRELLSPTRHRYYREVWALRDVDLDVERGKVVGIVGVNGAGKSTLLKLISGSITPTTGTVEVHGRISSILELGTGFQPHLTGRQNALINALFLGLRPWEAESKLDDILAFAELGDYANQPLSTYSTGMQARLAFSVLTMLNPEVLILDEALAAGDAGFAEKCKQFIRNLCRSGCTSLVASHDLRFVETVCDYAIWIDHGLIKSRGDPAEVVDAFRNSMGLARPKPEDHTARPKNVLLRFTPVDSSPPAQPFLLFEASWLDADGELLLPLHPGLDNVYSTCLAAATELGLMPGSARAGWGETQNLGVNGGINRPCRPDLGPGGAAYLGLPVPPPPAPAPAKLRITAYHDRASPAVSVSLLVNGHFREICRLGPRDDPWWTPEVFDVRFAFANEGTPSPRFDETLVKGPPARLAT